MEKVCYLHLLVLSSVRILSDHATVYNLTAFAKDHPGGIDVLCECAGTDGTEVYEYAGHSESALSVLDRFQVGVLEGHESSTSVSSAAAATASAAASTARKDGKAARLKMQIRVPSMVGLGGVVFLMALLVTARVCWGGVGTRSGAASENSTLLHPLSAFLLGLAATCGVGFSGLAMAYTKFKGTLSQEKDVFEYPSVIPVRR